VIGSADEMGGEEQKFQNKRRLVSDHIGKRKMHTSFIFKLLILLPFTLNGCNGATQCSTGTYLDSAANSTCVDCPAGKYNPATGQTQCWDCDEGR
jgi:hypothetical protein